MNENGFALKSMNCTALVATARAEIGSNMVEAGFARGEKFLASESTTLGVARRFH